MQKAFEVWASGAETPVRCRLPTCGHVAYLPAAKFSIFECPTCGDALPEQSGVASRDYVPKADLTWQGATCQKQGAFTQSCFNAVRLGAVYALFGIWHQIWPWTYSDGSLQLQPYAY